MRINEGQFARLLPILRRAETMRAAGGPVSAPDPVVTKIFLEQLKRGGESRSALEGIAFPVASYMAAPRMVPVEGRRTANANFIGGLSRRRMREMMAEGARGFQEGKNPVDPQSLTARPDKLRPSRLVRAYLRSFRSQFLPSRLGLIHLAKMLDLNSATFHEWLYGFKPMPISKFMEMVGLLRISDPSWLFFLIYQDELRRYFKPVIVEGRIVLVTRRGGYEEAIDYPFLRDFGLGGLLYRRRVDQGLTLGQVAEAINKLPAMRDRGWRVTPAIVSSYERNIGIPNRPRNKFFLDLLIAALGLNPSAAYIGAGRPWLPRLIRVHDRSAPLCGSEGAPDPRRPISYQTVRKSDTAIRGPGKGFGDFVRRARLLSGYKQGAVKRKGGVSASMLRDIEQYGQRASYETLRKLAVVFARGIQQLSEYSKDPLEELVIRHNLVFYRSVPRKLLLALEKPIFLSSFRDARVARRLLRLPENDFRRKLFVFRTSRGLSATDIAEELKVSFGSVCRLEDPKRKQIPSWEEVRTLALKEDPKGTTLDAWRRSVRETFYDRIPWDFLERNGIYIAGLRDARQIEDHRKQGFLREDDIGWVIWKLRLGLKQNRLYKAAAKAYRMVDIHLAEIELGRTLPTNLDLEKISVETGFDLERLRWLRDEAPRKREIPIRHDPRDLREIHTAGVDLEGEEILPQFAAFAENGLRDWEKKALAALWDNHNRLVRVFGGNGGLWSEHPEYVMPSRPLEFAFDLLSAGTAQSLTDESIRKVARLHHLLRLSLAGEGVWERGIRPDYLSRIRYRLVRGDLPVRHGTIPVPLDAVDGAILRLQKEEGSFTPGQLEGLREGLIRMVIMYRYRLSRGWGASGGGWLARNLFPDADDLCRERLRNLLAFVTRSPQPPAPGS